MYRLLSTEVDHRGGFGEDIGKPVLRRIRSPLIMFRYHVYPYSDCFKQDVRWICNKPRIKVGNKYKDFFLNTDVAIV